MNNRVKNYLSFSKKETIAVIVVAAVIGAFAILPFVWKNDRNAAVRKQEVPADAEWLATAAEVRQAGQEPVSGSNENFYSKNGRYTGTEKSRVPVAGRLFRFDPNTATPQQLKELGMRDKTISILTNYRNKGGRFRQADDLKKIYGLRPDEFERLKPFITIEQTNRPSASWEQRTTVMPSRTDNYGRYERKPMNIIDINLADTTAFQSLYGIGSRLAARIVNFRKKLGGFYTIEQVGETYGVPPETFQQISHYLKMGEPVIKKMNLNTTGYDELKNHPYIRSKLAYLIMKYRKEKGKFSTLDELKELTAETDASYEKIINYVIIY